MLMRVDKRRHDDAAFGVDIFCIRICLFYLFCRSYFHNSGSIHRHCSIFQKRSLRVSCDHSSITDNQHVSISFSLFFLIFRQNLKNFEYTVCTWDLPRLPCIVLAYCPLELFPSHHFYAVCTINIFIGTVYHLKVRNARLKYKKN